MQLYVSDFVGDTMHLSAEQVGAYMLLLMAMWNAGGRLSDDDVKLARIVRMTVKRWRSVAPDIMGFFSRSEGTVTHRRLSEEIEKSDRKSELRAAAGSNGGKAKALKEREARIANASVLPCHSSEPDRREEDSSLRSLSRPVASDTDRPMTDATERKTVERATEPTPRTTRSPSAPTEHPDFAEFWSAYPRRLGTNSRAGAAERFGALAKSGVDPGALIAGARRYAEQCAARGVIGSEFVQQATTWLNPKNRAWEEAYELPDQPQQPQRRDGGRQQAGGGNPLLAACRDRMSRLGDGGRSTDPSPGPSGRDPFGDPSPHGFDRGEPVGGDYRGGDRRRGGDAFDDAASWR
jgi:uncharacterized protein YdaU (DUF1376 family)